MRLPELELSFRDIADGNLYVTDVELSRSVSRSAIRTANSDRRLYTSAAACGNWWLHRAGWHRSLYLVP